MDFGVRPAGTRVPAFAGYSTILDDDAANARVGHGGMEAVFRQA
jgi:hypothetical protein